MNKKKSNSKWIFIPDKVSQLCLGDSETLLLAFILGWVSTKGNSVYLSAADVRRSLPAWTPRKTARIFKALKDAGIIKTWLYDCNKRYVSIIDEEVLTYLKDYKDKVAFNKEAEAVGLLVDDLDKLIHSNSGKGKKVPTLK